MTVERKSVRLEIPVIGGAEFRTWAIAKMLFNSRDLSRRLEFVMLLSPTFAHECDQ